MAIRPFDWTDMLGQHQVIAIHAPILAWTRDYHATALFEELVWRWNDAGRQTFSVTDPDLAEKLFLTIDQVRGARARLVSLGALATERRGIPARLIYTMHLDVAKTGIDAAQPDDSPEHVRAQARTGAGSGPDSDGVNPEHSIDTECLQNKDTATAYSPVVNDTTGLRPPVSTNGTGPAPAKTRTRRKATARTPLQLGQGSTIYRDVVKLTPNATQRVMLDAAFDKHGARHMVDALERWLAKGWSPKNVPGMVDFMDGGDKGRRADANAEAFWASVQW